MIIKEAIMKKDYSSLAKVLAVIALLSIMFGGFLTTRRKNQLAEATKLPYHNISLEQIPDGFYKARTETSFLHIELQVQVENHKIIEIKVIEADGIDAVPAQPVLDRMIAENKIAVQAVKGAELGSLVYISCVDKALYSAIAE